jgi:hypothetical protein
LLPWPGVVAEVGIEHMLRAAALQYDLAGTVGNEQIDQALQFVRRQQGIVHGHPHLVGHA